MGHVQPPCYTRGASKKVSCDQLITQEINSQQFLEICAIARHTFFLFKSTILVFLRSNLGVIQNVPTYNHES